jgi:hypothetical protein
MIPIEYWTNEIWMMIEERITNSKFGRWIMANEFWAIDHG